jgi:hypothetical protein
MICPKCEFEYLEGVTVCSDCGSDLIPIEEFEGHLVHPKDWVIVFTCGENYEAEMIKANLEGAKIDTLILSQKDSSYVVMGDLSVVKVLVKKGDAAAALQIISDIDSSEGKEE